jgi:hypothetical protein
MCDARHDARIEVVVSAVLVTGGAGDRKSVV